MEEARKKFLTKHKKELQDGIFGLELDVRHLERQKISSNESELNNVEQGIKTAKTKIKMYKDRIQLIDDILNEG